MAKFTVSGSKVLRVIGSSRRKNVPLGCVKVHLEYPLIDSKSDFIVGVDKKPLVERRWFLMPVSEYLCLVDGKNNALSGRSG